MKSSFVKGVLALLLGVAMFLIPGLASADEGVTSSWEQEAVFTDAEVAELEGYLNTLFTQVVVEDPGTGALRIDYDAAVRLFPDKDLSVLLPSVEQPDPGASPEGVKEYAWCVVKGAVPFIGLLDVDWGLIRMWVRQHDWGALSRYLGKEIPKRAAKIGIKDAINLAPWGIALKLAASAVGCVVWRGW